MNLVYSRGFTLIELLVVIAIIGMLSAVVLASLGTARNRSNDAGIKQDLRAVQTQAVLYQTANNSFGTAVSNNSCAATAGTLFSDTVIARAITAAELKNGAGTGVRCNSSATAYAVQSSLPGGGYWCVDSASKATSTAAAIAAGTTACP